MVTTAMVTTAMVTPVTVTVPVDIVAMAIVPTGKTVKGMQLEDASFLPLLQVKKLFTWPYGAFS